MNAMVTTLADELVWIDECHDLGDGAVPRRHKHVSVYLLRGEGDVLVDSGSFHHRDAIRHGVAAATGGEPVDALLLSHSDYPHSANVREFAATDDDAELVASSGAPEKQGLPEATKCEIGGTMTVAGREFSFVDPPLADRSHSTWIYDHRSATLFTADGFGSRHRPGACSETSADLADGVPFEAVHEYHRADLPWLPYVDPERLRAALEAILAEYPIEWIAPIHGHPIAGDDVDDYLDRLIDAAARIADESELPV